MTANVMQGDRDKCIAVGMDDHCQVGGLNEITTGTGVSGCLIVVTRLTNGAATNLMSIEA